MGLLVLGLERLGAAAAQDGNVDATPVEFVVDVADLPKPPEGGDDDVKIVPDGDRCPSPAG